MSFYLCGIYPQNPCKIMIQKIGQIQIKEYSTKYLTGIPHICQDYEKQGKPVKLSEPRRSGDVIIKCNVVS